MNREVSEPCFSTLADAGYVWGNSAYTCCYNCTRRDDCPMEAKGKRCTREHRTCPSCTRWNKHGCRHFILDW